MNLLSTYIVKARTDLLRMVVVVLMWLLFIGWRMVVTHAFLTCQKICFRASLVFFPLIHLRRFVALQSSASLPFHFSFHVFVFLFLFVVFYLVLFSLFFLPVSPLPPFPFLLFPFFNYMILTDFFPLLELVWI